MCSVGLECKTGCVLGTMRLPKIGSLKSELTDSDVSLSSARYVRCAVSDWLVQIHIAVANLDVESAIGITAYPSLIVDWRALTPKV